MFCGAIFGAIKMGWLLFAFVLAGPFLVPPGGTIFGPANDPARPGYGLFPMAQCCCAGCAPEPAALAYKYGRSCNRPTYDGIARNCCESNLQGASCYWSGQLISPPKLHFLLGLHQRRCQYSTPTAASLTRKSQCFHAASSPFLGWDDRQHCFVEGEICLELPLHNAQMVDACGKVSGAIGAWKVCNPPGWCPFFAHWQLHLSACSSLWHQAGIHSIKAHMAFAALRHPCLRTLQASCPQSMATWKGKTTERSCVHWNMVAARVSSYWWGIGWSKLAPCFSCRRTSAKAGKNIAKAVGSFGIWGWDWFAAGAP